METLDLAKLRAVDTSLLGAAAQYLPALYVPFNAADDAVSTDFAPLTVIATPAGASNLGGLTVAIAGPTMNATVGRSVQITGSVNAAPGVAPGVVTGVQIQFGADGPTAQATLAAQSWSWQGLIPTSIRPGQSFQIIATASGSRASAGPPPTQVPLSGQDVVNVVLENVVPVLTVDPFPSVVTVTQVPYVTTLSGSISEGNGAPYTTPLVQYRVGTGPLANLTVAQEKWSVPLSLQAGDNLITVQASDAFGSVTAFQKTLTVVVQTA
jgi:hypothetical protein